MAGIKFAAAPGEISISTSAVTLLQITAPTNQRVKVREWEINFKGTSNTGTPICYRVMRQSSGNGTGSALTLVKWDADYSETIQATAKHTFTVEPTSNLVTIAAGEIHPQQGYGWVAPFDGEIVIPGGESLNFEVTAAAANTATIRAVCEE